MRLLRSNPEDSAGEKTLGSLIVMSRGAPRRRVAAALSVAVLGVSIAPSVLDARERGETASIEAAHDPGRCLSRHDHAACSQLARSGVVHAGSSPEPYAGHEICAAGITRHEDLTRLTQRSPLLPRAPPPHG